MGLAVAHVICTPHLCRQWCPVCVISWCLFFFMHKSISLLSWNVRGLSQDDKSDDVLSELISAAPLRKLARSSPCASLNTLPRCRWDCSRLGLFHPCSNQLFAEPLFRLCYAVFSCRREHLHLHLHLRPHCTRRQTGFPSRPGATRPT